MTELGPEMWSEEGLLAKSRVYFQRASDAAQQEGLSAFWSLIGLELLARAAVARVHPALLADPQAGGAHLLFAFGHGKEDLKPRSVPIKTVFSRCQRIIPRFTEAMFNDAMALMEIRNEELHTGGLILEELKPSIWQPPLYAVIQTIVGSLGLEMNEVLPEERAKVASRVLEELDETIESEVKQRVADVARAFGELDEEEQERRRLLPVPASGGVRRQHRIAACPSCGTDGLVSGQVVGTSAPTIGDGNIEQELVVLPSEYRCGACNLELNGLAQLHHAGLGDEFSVKQSEDPIEYFGIDPTEYVSIEDLVEPDYGND